MKKYWKKLTSEQIRERVFSALSENVDFRRSKIMGVPASHLDGNVFYDDFPFLSTAPFLTSLVKNPNHIGCHTIGESELFFKGTQDIERETIELLAVDLFNAEANSIDGYIASGGTEANIQACWAFRNKFIKDGFRIEDIAIVCSEDTHYSMPKAANILDLDLIQLEVNADKRTINLISAKERLSKSGKKALIVILNMGTTMFGSVDDISLVEVLKELNLSYHIHVDGAYGGFIYAVSCKDNKLDFSNTEIDSITIDAHKMLQAPYGTGIYLARKGIINNTITQEAGYVHGLDLTLSGSRSGANAIAVWMILMTYGYYGWKEQIQTLLNRTDYLCEKLGEKNISFFREPNLNIVTLHSDYIDKSVCERYGLVPEKHDGNNKYWKIVVMTHVDMDLINLFLSEI